MIEYIKRLFCRHGNMQIVEDYEWVPLFLSAMNYHEKRKYMVCNKCGYKRKISNK